jgi:hypothetical protein
MGLGEDMEAVHRTVEKSRTGQLVTFSLLSTEEMQDAIGADVTIRRCFGDEPSVREDSAARVTAALTRGLQHNTKHSTLCITHGFGVEQAGLLLASPQHIPTTNYCGYVVLDANTRRLILSDGVPLTIPVPDPKCAIM